MTSTSSAKTTCCYCGVGCGVEVRVDRAGRLTVQGDVMHPVNQGDLCSKGRYLHRVAMDRSDRILYPRLRRSREASLERVSWDDAMQHTAAAFRRLIETHGPDSVGFYVSGQMLTEEYYVANKLVKGFIGTSNIDTNSRLCMSSAVVGFQMALGEDAPPVSYEDVDLSDCFLIAGANPAWCHPILFRRLERRKAMHPEVKVIVVDPRRTPSCAVADLHLQIRPGTDLALYNALAAQLIQLDLVDRDFVVRSTEGFDEVAAEVAPWTPERAADVCGIPADDIRLAARWIGESAGFIPMWAMGLNQSVHGVKNNLALLNLSLLTGKIGKPGSGPLSLTGQPNAMGGREVGGLATTLAAHRSLSNPRHRDEVAAFWGVKSVPDQPGLTATAMFEALESGSMKAVWIICTNPAVTLPDLKRVERALARAELVVVQDVSERSGAIPFADVVLPAAAWLEKEGTMTNSERRITYLPKVLDPPGEALPDAEILCRFAAAMGWRDAFDYTDASTIYREHARLTAGTTIDVSGISHRRLQADRSIQWPCPTPAHPGTPRLFADGRFPTETGRARLHGVRVELPPEPTEAFPFVLLTGRLRDQWHTRTKTGKVARLNLQDAVPRLEMHPSDAARLTLRDGAVVQVASEQGSLSLPLRITDDVRPGCVFLPMHWGRLTGERDARVNVLTANRIDPLSRQPDLKYTAVRVWHAPKARERVLVVGGGAAARQFVESYRALNTTDEIHVFGREPHLFYNRVLLPEYVNGERPWAALQTASRAQLERLDVHFHAGRSIEYIDRDRREIQDDLGRSHGYDKLLLATGSRAFVPLGVPVDLPGVFTLRSRADADRIRTHLRPGARVVIMGGGLLGLELAAALEVVELSCTVLEMAPRLMHRQLDPMASEILREELEERGIRVLCGDAIASFHGEERITRVETESGREIPCDTLIVAVGTRPNISLAADAGLDYQRGVLVNHHLQTSDPNIYAAGEIAELDGRLWGTTAAAEDQARIAAAHVNGDTWTTYEGSVPFNVLKIHGLDVRSVGQVPGPEAGYEEAVFHDRGRRAYKRCILFEDRLIGAVLVGDPSGFEEYRSLIATGIELEEKRLTLLGGVGVTAAEPPVGRLVCTCNNVGAGNLQRHIADGFTTVEALCGVSRAGTGCGSCRPEVRQILETALQNQEPLRKTA